MNFHAVRSMTYRWLWPVISFDSKASSTGSCSEDNNVGIRNELKVIPDSQMTASSNNGDTFLPKFGRLEGTSAWCPDPAEMVLDGPYLRIDMGQKYVICGVEAQGLPGVSVTTSFKLSFSDDDLSYTGYNSDQVIGKTTKFVTCISVTFPLTLPPPPPPVSPSYSSHLSPSHSSSLPPSVTFPLLPFVTFPLPLSPCSYLFLSTLFWYSWLY